MCHARPTPWKSRDLLLLRGIHALLGHVEAKALRAPIVDVLHYLLQAFASDLLRALEHNPDGLQSHLRRTSLCMGRDTEFLREDALRVQGEHS